MAYNDSFVSLGSRASYVKALVEEFVRQRMAVPPPVQVAAQVAAPPPAPILAPAQPPNFVFRMDGLFAAAAPALALPPLDLEAAADAEIAVGGRDADSDSDSDALENVTDRLNRVRVAEETSARREREPRHPHNEDRDASSRRDYRRVR